MGGAGASRSSKSRKFLYFIIYYELAMLLILEDRHKEHVGVLKDLPIEGTQLPLSRVMSTLFRILAI